MKHILRDIEEIALCFNCSGRGYNEYSECINEHNGDCKDWEERCKTCGGSGRLLHKTNVMYSPYKNKRLGGKPQS